MDARKLRKQIDSIFTEIETILETLEDTRGQIHVDLSTFEKAYRRFMSSNINHDLETWRFVVRYGTLLKFARKVDKAVDGLGCVDKVMQLGLDNMLVDTYMTGLEYKGIPIMVSKMAKFDEVLIAEPNARQWRIRK